MPLPAAQPRKSAAKSGRKRKRVRPEALIISQHYLPAPPDPADPLPDPAAPPLDPAAPPLDPAEPEPEPPAPLDEEPDPPALEPDPVPSVDPPRRAVPPLAVDPLVLPDDALSPFLLLLSSLRSAVLSDPLPVVPWLIDEDEPDVPPVVPPAPKA